VLVGWVLEAVGVGVKRLGQRLEEVGCRCRGGVVRSECNIVESEANIKSAERVVVVTESVKSESNIELAAERVVVIAPGESIIVKSGFVSVKSEPKESVDVGIKSARSSQRARGRGRGSTRGRAPLITTGCYKNKIFFIKMACSGHFF